jgi:phage/plasmid-associated DNA primase
MQQNSNPLNIFGGNFSDSEDEYEVVPDIQEASLNVKIQDKYNTNMRNFREFMSNADYVTIKGDEETNIVDMCAMFNDKFYSKTYNIPDDKIPKMFKFIELCRRDNLHQMLYEKQQTYSGFMIDFDIYQKGKKSHITKDAISSVATDLYKLLKKYINLSQPDSSYENGECDIYMACIQKPEPKLNAEKNIYKDGFHILIPGIKLTRHVKTFLLNKCIEDGLFKTLFNTIDIAEGHKFEDIVDINSKHVPIFLLGSSSKPNTPPYKLTSIKLIKSKVEHFDDIETNPLTSEVLEDFMRGTNGTVDPKNSPIVLAHELSVNWEKPRGIIKKRQYEPREEYIAMCETMKKQPKNASEEALEHGELSIANISDPDAEFIEGMLNCLHPSRYKDFELWFKVLCVLSHTSKSYRELAENFSMKCVEKYNPVDFEHHWQSASTNKKNKLNIGSLHFWAKNDNPERYEIVRKNSLGQIANAKVFDPQLEGNLQHYDVAKILFYSLKHKYVYDTANGGIWYEFILVEDKQKKGEIYKWRSYPDSQPNSLKVYTSEILPILFTKVFHSIEKQIEKGSENEVLNKYNRLVKQNLKITCRKIRDNGFKNALIRECEQVFQKFDFSEKLDKAEDILGVSNGILKLGKQVEFITGYHPYCISEFTPVDYIPFDPYNAITKKLLKALRNIFPDDEPDTFEFIMCYFASCLDRKKKESLIAILVGGGSNAKSFILELVGGVMGPYRVKLPLSFLTSRQKNAEGATPALMQLRKARMAQYSESEKNETLHLAKVKEFTGQETMGGRNLNEGWQNFKPTCHHVVGTNYDFEINGNDHGSWRRIKKVPMKIKFCKAGVDDYDENNPYERIADPTMIAQWTEDPEVLSSFLSILCHYYEILQSKYNGLVENVPHPHVQLETEQYRDRQDKVNNFINIRFVKGCKDNDYVLTIAQIIEKYTKWHDGLYPDDKEYKKSIGYQIENSKLIKLFTKSRTGPILKGYRILDADEEPDTEAGETYLMDNIMNGKKGKFKDISSEDCDQYYANICKEFEATKLVKAELVREEKKKIQQKRMKAIADAKNAPKVADAKPIPYKKNVDIIPNSNSYDKSGFRVIDTIDKKEFICELRSDDEESSDDEPLIKKTIIKRESSSSEGEYDSELE